MKLKRNNKLLLYFIKIMPIVWEITKFPLPEGPPIYLSSDYLPQPWNSDNILDEHHNQLKSYNIGTILNVSASSKAKPHHIKWYQNIGIEFCEIPIEDSANVQLAKFLKDCNKFYANRQDKEKAILVHCSAGINRSGAAVMGIIWKNTAHSSDISWRKSPKNLLTWMRQRQTEDRQLTLLGNDWMAFQAIQWCKEN